MKNALSFRTTFESLHLVINKNLAEIDNFVVHIVFAFVSFNKLDLLIVRSVGIRRQYFIEQFCINCPPILQMLSLIQPPFYIDTNLSLKSELVFAFSRFKTNRRTIIWTDYRKLSQFCANLRAVAHVHGWQWINMIHRIMEYQKSGSIRATRYTGNIVGYINDNDSDGDTHKLPFSGETISIPFITVEIKVFDNYFDFSR